MKTETNRNQQANSNGASVNYTTETPAINGSGNEPRLGQSDPEIPRLARGFIKNYQQAASEGAISLNQSSWLVKISDIADLLSVPNVDHVHIFLGCLDSNTPSNVTLVLVPVKEGGHIPFTKNGSTFVTEQVVPCPQCNTPAGNVPFAWNELDFGAD